MGSGPVSGEVRAYTAEGAPSAPPQDVLCTTLTAQTIRVSWVSPPLAAANGLIKAYKVIYGPSDTWYGKCHTTFNIKGNVLKSREQFWVQINVLKLISLAYF